MKYVATEAGPCKLHVWCDPNDKDERVAFPGSPFALSVSPGVASTEVSQVTGWSKLQKEEKNAKYGKNAASDPNALVAGDTLMIRPEIFDQYGNPTVLAEGALEVIHELEDTGAKSPLRYTQQQIRGSDLYQYDVRHDTSASGNHFVHLLIGGTAIKGSPVTFRVQPDKPDPQSCKLTGPLHVEPDEVLGVDRQYTCLLRTYDKYGNHCWVGGHKFGTRLQLIKQSVHDQTALVPQNHTLESEDLGDGTYHIHVTLNFPCSVKLFANLDKNLPASAGELPPLTLNFVKLDNPGGAPAGAAGRERRGSFSSGTPSGEAKSTGEAKAEQAAAPPSAVAPTGPIPTPRRTANDAPPPPMDAEAEAAEAIAAAKKAFAEAVPAIKDGGKDSKSAGAAGGVGAKTPPGSGRSGAAKHKKAGKAKGPSPRGAKGSSPRAGAPSAAKTSKGTE